MRASESESDAGGFSALSSTEGGSFFSNTIEGGSFSRTSEGGSFSFDEKRKAVLNKSQLSLIARLEKRQNSSSPSRVKMHSPRKEGKTNTSASQSLSSYSKDDCAEGSSKASRSGLSGRVEWLERAVSVQEQMWLD